jgi:hypothetical protein
MPYAFVEDIPASWEYYEPPAAVSGDQVPEGLILHVAGPTDEGFRTIDIWETREAWEEFRHNQLARVAPPFSRVAASTLRELRALHTVHGGRGSSKRAEEGDK